MIKRRVNTNISETDFINGIDNVEPSTPVVTPVEATEKPNPKAPRKYKSHTLPLNEHEYNLLVELADKYGQTHSGIIRYALKQLALKDN